MDPAQAPSDAGSLEPVVRALYGALAAGDRAAVLAVLDPSFTARFAEGMPAGGGRADGPEDALAHWWAIGRAFAVVAEPTELVPCADGRLLVLGRYRGRSRDGAGGRVDAAFAHVWTGRDGRLAALEQITDTARWRAPGNEEEASDG